MLFKNRWTSKLNKENKAENLLSFKVKFIQEDMTMVNLSLVYLVGDNDIPTICNIWNEKIKILNEITKITYIFVI